MCFIKNRITVLFVNGEMFVLFPVVPQDVQDQALPCKEAEAEQADSPVDKNEDRQQDQVSSQNHY